MKVPYLVSHFV